MLDLERHDDDLDPVLKGLFDRAYWHRLGVDAAGRHLWRLHKLTTGPLRVRRVSARASSVAVMALVMLLALSGTVSVVRVQEPAEVQADVAVHDGPAGVYLTVVGMVHARAYLAYSERRLSDAEGAVTLRPAIVPDLVEVAVTSLERAEQIGGPELSEESRPLRETMSRRVSELAANPGIEEHGRDKLLAFSVRLIGSGDHLDPVVATTRNPRSGQPADADAGTAQPADDGAEEPVAAVEPETPEPDQPSDEPTAAPDDGDGADPDADTAEEEEEEEVDEQRPVAKPTPPVDEPEQVHTGKPGGGGTAQGDGGGEAENDAGGDDDDEDDGEREEPPGEAPEPQV